MWVVIVVIVLIAFVGLTIDTGYLVWSSQQLQVGADGAALAGTALIRTDIPDARLAAQNIGLANVAATQVIQIGLNEANAPEGDIVVGRFDRATGLFDPNPTFNNALKAVARRTDTSLGGPIGLLFGPAFGVDTASLEREAIAMIKGGLGAGVIALNSTEQCAFNIRGTAGSFSVEGGIIYVNSDDPDAACHSGRPTLGVDELYITGDTDGRFDDQVNFDGDYYTGEDPILDPLADLPEPNYDPTNDFGTVSVEGGETLNVTPGYYSGGFNVRNGRLNVAPGLYILDGEGLDVNGGDLIADGVMFFIVDTTPEDNNDSRVDIRGNGVIQISGMTPIVYPLGPGVPSELENISVPIFQARDNTNDSRILGTSSFSIDGTIYMPSNHIDIGGTSDNFATGLIADTIEAFGDGDLVINYNDQFAPLPKTVYLVQ